MWYVDLFHFNVFVRFNNQSVSGGTRELGTFPSFPIFWKGLCNTGINSSLSEWYNFPVKLGLEFSL